MMSISKKKFSVCRWRKRRISRFFEFKSYDFISIRLDARLVCFLCQWNTINAFWNGSKTSWHFVKSCLKSARSKSMKIDGRLFIIHFWVSTWNFQDHPSLENVHFERGPSIFSMANLSKPKLVYWTLKRHNKTRNDEG